MSSKLDEIDDIAELCEIVKSFGLKTKGLNTSDQMKSRLSEHLKYLEGSSTRKVGEVSNHSPSLVGLITNTHYVATTVLVKVLCECTLSSRCCGVSS